MPQLIINRGTKFHKEFVFDRSDIVLIGRAPSNDICLPDPSRKVSRSHAALIRVQGEPEAYFIRDLSSLRSTLVGGVPVYSKTLNDGDLIEVGDYEMTYCRRFIAKNRPIRLRVVEQKADSTVLERSTVLFTHQEMLKEQTLTPEQQELIEDVLRQSRYACPLTELLRFQVAPLVRVLKAQRGFACLFGEGDTHEGCEEVGAVGLDAEEQIEITDTQYMDRIRAGNYLRDGSTLLAPIYLREQVLGFFCIDRASPHPPFTDEEATFLVTVGRLATARPSGSTAGRKLTQPVVEVMRWPGELVGRSRPMEELFRDIQDAAATDTNVLVLGETGTGKELVARAIHQSSRFRKGPWIAHNCAAITETLAETQIFGYVPKSGIAGANPEGAPGWFELASGGTLFLDEIQALAPTIQDKLLRVLQERQVWRVGSRSPISIDVKVVAASDQDLERAAHEGRMRKALFHRFGKRIGVRPLRERQEDIALLTYYFLDRFASEGHTQVRAVSHRAMHNLQAYSWPGNVRELENCLRSACGKEQEVLFTWDFPSVIPTEHVGTPKDDANRIENNKKERALHSARPKPMLDVEREKILEALEVCRGNITQAGRALGYRSRQTMLNKMEKYGIPRTHGDPDESW